MEVTRVTAIRFPDGTRIDVSTDEGKYYSGVSESGWKTLNVFRSGKQMAGKNQKIIDIDYDQLSKKATLSVYAPDGTVVFSEELPIGEGES